ncbi:MAG: hypothetical protein ACK5YO_02950, partial [Planctomyces sp.]
ILTGVRPEEISLLGSEMEAAIHRSEELSEALSETMEQAAEVIAGKDLQEAASLLKLVPAGEGAVREPALAGTVAARSSGTGQSAARVSRGDEGFWAAVEQVRRD